MRKLWALVLLIPFLVGCGATLNSKSIEPVVFAKDLAAAQANFEAAGLPVEAQCMSDAIAKLTQNAGVNYQVVGIVSFGSVAYIAATRVQEEIAKGPNALTPACQAIVGKVVLAIGSKAPMAFGF